MKFSSILLAFLVVLLLAWLGYKAVDGYVSDRPTRELPYYGKATVDSSGKSPTQDFWKVPDFQFFNQDSIAVTPETFAGKVYVTDFFFTTCEGICPKMTSQMERVYQRFQNEPSLMFLSHTVNPEYDTVSVLREFAMEHEADSKKWHFVTGPKEAIYRMAREGYFVSDTKGNGGREDFVHTENFALIDKERHIRGYYDGTDSIDVNRLMADIEQLLKYYRHREKNNIRP